MDAVTEDVHPDLKGMPVDLIEKAGRSIFYAFRSWVELEDCVQEAWAGYFGNRSGFDRQIADGNTGYVSKALRYHVGEWARAQKASACGYVTSDEEFYSRRRLRHLLEFYLAGEPIPMPANVLGTKVKGTSNAIDFTEMATELRDVERGWQALDQGSRDDLWLAYGPEVPEPGTYGDRERKRAQRALGRLVDLLNGIA